MAPCSPAAVAVGNDGVPSAWVWLLVRPPGTQPGACLRVYLPSQPRLLREHQGASQGRLQSPRVRRENHESSLDRRHVQETQSRLTEDIAPCLRFYTSARSVHEKTGRG